MVNCFICNKECTLEEGIVRYFQRVHPKCWDEVKRLPTIEKIDLIEKMMEDASE